ncbi:MAG: hypothetical protein GWO24_28715, partial [Akkermansiaceae bacterium]|nr:hypothetical protein [Akkermansiaceae bacterium]
MKDAITQIEGVIACASLAHLADRQSHLATAKDLLNYLETRFVDEKTGGVALFEFPAPQEATAGAYLWSREDLQE